MSETQIDYRLSPGLLSGVPKSPTPLVYAAISKVTEILARTGIGKTGRNEQQGYAFRGIDAIYNALAPALVEAHLIMLPTFGERIVSERVTPKGGTIFTVVLPATYALICTDDGSKVDVHVVGEGMDSGDKATNKAMTAAHKYAAVQAFTIPFAGVDDADQTTPPDSVPAPPAGYNEWLAQYEASAEKGSASLLTFWQQTREDCRVYLVTTDRARHEATKAKAAQVTP
jgi:hypothetical protein